MSCLRSKLQTDLGLCVSCGPRRLWGPGGWLACRHPHNPPRAGRGPLHHCSQPEDPGSKPSSSQWPCQEPGGGGSAHNCPDTPSLPQKIAPQAGEGPGGHANIAGGPAQVALDPAGHSPPGAFVWDSAAHACGASLPLGQSWAEGLTGCGSRLPPTLRPRLGAQGSGTARSRGSRTLSPFPRVGHQGAHSEGRVPGSSRESTGRWGTAFPPDLGPCCVTSAPHCGGTWRLLL